MTYKKFQKEKIRLLGVMIILALNASALNAEEIELNNGDHISGTIIEETAQTLILQTEAMGRVVINKEFIKSEEVPMPEKEVPSPWTRTISLGYSQTEGNTQKSRFNGKLDLHKKMDKAEFNAQIRSHIATSNNKEDARKYYGMIRNAYSFGNDFKWYHFYKLEGEQDRFANIDYRITPSTGVGYWFSDEDEFKAMTELAFGFERTNYRDNTEEDSEAIVIPRVYFEKLFFDELRLSEDMTLYPSLSSFGEYRFRSETDIAHPINDRVSVKLSFIDEYESDPGGSAKKNDYRLISSMDINF